MTKSTTRTRKRAKRQARNANTAPRASSRARKGGIGRRPRRRWWRRRLFVYPLIVLVALIAAPLAMTLVYRVETIRPVSTLMLARMVTFQPVDRQWVGLEEISPRLVNSVIMSEDGQFCRHYGIDLRQLRLVIGDALEGEGVRGASTIPMQVAKNLFLWQDRSLVRKLLEAPLAVWIDLVLPKKRIMEIYLNIAEWGPSGQFGIKAGAAYHFGRSPDALTARQSALLAVTLPNPHVRDPARPSASMNQVATIIERRAANAGPFVTCLRPDQR